MSILNVNQIQPVGSGQTVTISAANITASSSTISASSFVGPLTGNVTGSVSGGSFSGISTAGITTVYIGSINDGSISGARNRIINGDMRLDQRNSGASVTPTTLTYTVDRWAAAEQTDGSMTVQQSGTVPVGFTSSLLVTVTSADSSLGATQYATLRQAIEGVNISDLNWGTSNARPVTLSFWVRSSLTGAFGGAIQNNAQDRSYPFSYTINSANTFEYKTVTIPGDTTGTWLTNNSAGMFLWFSFAAGSTYSGTSATWASSLLFAPTDATNLLGTNGATWYLTGVQLEPGTVATPFERRSYGQELALAQRYCYRFGGDGTGYTLYTRWPPGNWAGTTIIAIPIIHPPMRSTNRTITGTGAIAIVSNTGGSGSSTPTYSFNGDAATETSTYVNIGNLSGGTDGAFASVRTNGNASAYVLITAEL